MATFYYETATKEEIVNMLSTLQWEKEGKMDIDDIGDDGESVFLRSFYGGIQTFGATDYEDHRNDSLGKLKGLVLPSFARTTHQRIHFYNADGSIVRRIVVRGYLGGYTSHFIYDPDRIERSIQRRQ